MKAVHHLTKFFITCLYLIISFGLIIVIPTSVMFLGAKIVTTLGMITVILVAPITVIATMLTLYLGIDATAALGVEVDDLIDNLID